MNIIYIFVRFVVFFWELRIPNDNIDLHLCIGFWHCLSRRKPLRGLYELWICLTPGIGAGLLAETPTGFKD